MGTSSNLQLLGAFAGDIGIRDRLDVQVFSGHRVQVVAGRRAVEDIRFEHRIKLHAGQFDAVVVQNMRVILQVMADFELAPGSSSHGFMAARTSSRSSCFGAPGIVMRDRQIGGLAGPTAKDRPTSSASM